MGYMGFGMQNVVYRQQPKKTYEISRKPAFIPLQNYSRTFKLKPSIKKNQRLRGFLTISIIGISFFFITISALHFNDYSKIHARQTANRVEQDNRAAFNFLMHSGMDRLRNNDLIEAYSEFKLACKIDPDNEQLKRLVIETASVLCAKEEKYCSDLNYYLSLGQ